MKASPASNRPPLRVAFAWDDPPETIGGGPAFGREILRAIDRMRNRCPHQLCMITQKRPDPTIGNWSWLKASSTARKGAVQGLVRKIKSLFRQRHPATLPPTGWRIHGRPLEEALDAVFFLYPDCYESVDIFQVATVFDLSHRYVPFFPEIGNVRERARRERLFRKITEHASFLITGTERSRQELETYYGWEKSLVRLIPHPTPASALMYAQENRPRRPGRPFALYPAQFWPHKNHVVLLEAWRLLRERGTQDLHLVFTGSDQGNENHVRQRAAALGLADCVEFRGFVSRQELLQLYVDAEMLVYPSLFGPENLPPLEAFALGCPAVVADVPGSEEQLGEAALRIPPRDARAWADAVAILRMDSSRRAELVAHGKRRAQRTTTETFAFKIFSLIEEIADLRSLWSKERFLSGVPFQGISVPASASKEPGKKLRIEQPLTHNQKPIISKPIRICIVTPSLNQGQYLDQAMRSVLEQDYPNLQYVVMDGGSKDQSPEIIRKHAGRLHAYRIGPDQGHYSAINEGFSLMPGNSEDIMGWLNSDDMYTPWAFEVVNQIFSRFPSVEWISSLYPILWGLDGLPHRTLEREKFSAPAFFDGENCGQNHLQQESTFWRRSLWDRAGGGLNPAWDLAGDFDLWSRFFRHAHCYGVATILGGFREHPAQKTSNQLDRYVQQSQRILRQARQDLPLGFLWRYRSVKKIARVIGKRGYFEERGWLAPSTFIAFDSEAEWKMIGPSILDLPRL